MKTRLLTFLFACFFVSTYAQIDVKINPLGLLFGSPDVSVDYALSDKFSVEGGIGLNLGDFSINGVDYNRRGSSFFAAGRNYFNPEDGADKFGVGIYTRFKNINSTVDGGADNSNNYTRNRFAVGLFCGWKWVSDNNIIFEIDLGAGRAFVDNIEFDDPDTNSLNIADIPALDIDVLIRFAVGYRFGSAGSR